MEAVTLPDYQSTRDANPLLTLEVKFGVIVHFQEFRKVDGTDTNIVESMTPKQPRSQDFEAGGGGGGGGVALLKRF